jgi:hypothetical protein
MTLFANDLSEVCYKPWRNLENNALSSLHQLLRNRLMSVCVWRGVANLLPLTSYTLPVVFMARYVMILRGATSL